MRGGIGIGVPGGGRRSALSPVSTGLFLWHETESAYVTTAGGAVSSLLDRSASASPAVQTTGANQGAHSAAAYNGHPGITFDGATDHLRQTVAMPLGSKTMGLAFKLATAPLPTALATLFRLKASGDAFMALALANFAGYLSLTFVGDMPAAGIAARGATVTLDTNPHTYIVTYNGGSNTANGSYTCYWDGVAQTVAASGSFNAVAANSCGCIGAQATTTAFDAWPLAGTVFRAAAWSAVHDAAQAAKDHAWLAQGYG